VRLRNAGWNEPRVQIRVDTVLGHRVDGACACNVGIVQATFHAQLSLKTCLQQELQRRLAHAGCLYESSNATAAKLQELSDAP